MTDHRGDTHQQLVGSNKRWGKSLAWECIWCRRRIRYVAAAMTFMMKLSGDQPTSAELVRAIRDGAFTLP